MSRVSERLQKKRSEKLVKEFIDRLENLKFIAFVDEMDVEIVSLKLSKFQVLESKSASDIDCSESAKIIEDWAKKNFNKVKFNGMAVICIGDSEVPIWCRVSFQFADVAFLEAWNATKTKEIVVCNEESKDVFALYNEEYRYEFYFEKNQ